MISSSSRIGILGLSRSGGAVYEFLKNKSNNILCFDDNPDNLARFAETHTDAFICDLSDNKWQKCNFFVVSPGIALYYPVMHKIAEMSVKFNIKIISDFDVFFSFYSQKKYIGITGTNGKSTCTKMLEHIFQFCGYNYVAAGNIGNAICLASQTANGYIIELSSYQLEITKFLKLDLAVCLGVTPDHQDRYANFQSYAKAKMRILHHLQPNVAVLSQDNEITKGWLNSNMHSILFSGRQISNNSIAALNNTLYDNIFDNCVYEIPSNKQLIGTHNNENMAACYAAARAFGLQGQKIIAAISCYPGLAHRLQYLGSAKNVNFYNDSKATNIDATSKALLSCENIYWIAGGTAKSKDFSALLKYASKIRHAYFFGLAKEDLLNCFDSRVNCQIFDSLQQATLSAYEDATLNGNEINTILLSPACASFDQFKDFEDRGKQFMDIVRLYLDL
jgi:UDP-N-acetylmuramoylalanine--D-glutamate ligase